MWVAFTLLLRAGLNFLGLAMLLPVLALVVDPESIQGTGVMARVYSELGFTSPRSFALTVCGAVVGVIIVKCLLTFWLARAERSFIYDLYRKLSRDLLVTYHDRGLAFVKTNNSAVLARNVNVVSLAFTVGVLRPAATIAAEAMLLILLFGALAWYAPIAALLVVVVFVPSIWLYYGLVRNRINRYGAEENKAQREKARLVTDIFRGYADIEINGAFPMMLRSFDRSMNEVIRTRLHEASIALLPQSFTEIGLAVGMALLVALSAGNGAQMQMLFGVFAVAALRLMPSVRNIMSGWTSIKYNRYTIETLREATAEDRPEGRETKNLNEDTPNDRNEAEWNETDKVGCTNEENSWPKIAAGNCSESRQEESTQTISKRPIINNRKTSLPITGDNCELANGGKLEFEREITLRNLSFRFADESRDLFHDLTFTIGKGERVGIRGASGAGKTTLFNLLLGLYEPTSGQIEIDGVPLTADNRRAWQNHIGYVSQNLFIADGSVAMNIALGVSNEQIDRERVAQVLEAAQLGEFIATLPDGIDTRVGEFGSRLSGGQRQRIGIARALYRRADVLFFDEATSALDSLTEKEINHSIAQLAARNRGLTLLVIAHRESSLEYCQRIITIGEEI